MSREQAARLDVQRLAAALEGSTAMTGDDAERWAPQIAAEYYRLFPVSARKLDMTPKEEADLFRADCDCNFCRLGIRDGLGHDDGPSEFDGPDCGYRGCAREVGHIGDHKRDPSRAP